MFFAKKSSSRKSISLEKRAILGKPGLFDNDSASDAAAVMEQIFSHSNKGSINIFAKNLNGQISSKSNYIKELKNFIVIKKAKLNVIIEEIPNLNEKRNKLNAYKIIKIFSMDSRYADKVQIKVIKPEYINDLNTEIKKAVSNNQQLSQVIDPIKNLHFAVNSNGMFRIETDNKTHTAKCDFGNIETADSISNMFQNFFSNNEYFLS